MNQFDLFDSVAIFGSTVRGDADEFSDLDLLVVSENAPSHASIELLRAKGFSPAIYSWNSLDKLSEYGSLFLEHLKRESEIIKDDNCRLQRFLVECRPSKDYTDYIQQAIELARLTTGIPYMPSLMGWAADVLSVALRNYLVAYAAQNGEYIFSNEALIDLARKEFGLNSEMTSVLADLRKFKSAYRQKGNIQNRTYPTLDKIQIAQSAFEAFSGENIYRQPFKCQEFASVLVSELPAKEPWYHSVRRYEGVYRIIGKRYFSSIEAISIESLIASPSAYPVKGVELLMWKVLRDYVLKGYRRSLS